MPRRSRVLLSILKHIVFAERVKFVAGLCLAFLLWPLRRRTQGGARKILVVPIVSRLGDLVCSTPVYRELAHALPSVHISVLCAKNVFGIIKHNPRIAEIINLNAVRYKGFVGRMRLFADIRRARFDAVVSLSNNPLGSVVAAISGAPLRIKTTHYPRTLAEVVSDFLNNVRAEYRDGSFLQAHYLRLLTPLGVAARPPVTEVFTTEAGERKAEAFLAAEGVAPTDTLVGISVSAGNVVKEWPPERFAKLADRLVRERGAKIVFVDAPADEAKIEQTMDAMREKRNVSIATNFTLEELSSLIKRLSLFIAVDTGTIYVAHALGIPLVDIIGPVEPHEQPPKDARSVHVLPPPPHVPSSFVLARPGSWKARRAAICATPVSAVYTAAVGLLERKPVCRQAGMNAAKSILVFVRSAKYLKAMKSIVAELSLRGFGITAVYDPGEGDEESLRILENFKRELPAFSYVVGLRRRGFLKRAARALRGLASYRMYVQLCGDTAFYTRHWLKFLPQRTQVMVRSALARRILASSLVGILLKLLERLLPADRRITRHIASLNPVAVLVAYRGQPPGCSDIDYLKASKKLGIPTLISVASWDSLTTKGKIHLPPDLLLVWNEKQKRDAVHYHNLKPETVRIVGAFQFDEWFALRRDIAPHREPNSLLYIASSALSGDNLSVPLSLRAAMNRDAVFKNVPLIVRPPLEDAHKYQISAAGILLEPRSYEGLGRDESAQIFLRSIGASFAAVGVHTTGLIDALIKGLPVIIYSPPEFLAVQEVPHFRELLASGAAYRATGPDEFVAIARALYEGRDEKRKGREVFVASLRPRGLATPAAIFAADEIERVLHP